MSKPIPKSTLFRWPLSSALTGVIALLALCCLGGISPALAQGADTLPVVASFDEGIPAGFGPYNDAFDGSTIQILYGQGYIANLPSGETEPAAAGGE